MRQGDARDAVLHRLSQAVRAQVGVEGLELLGVLPRDDTVLSRDEQGAPAYDTPADSVLYQAVDKLLSKMIAGAGAVSG